MQRGNNKIMGKSKKRAGFTLIEVIVAMAILMVVILALVSSYYSYYNSVKQMTYRAIGQNLAEVMLEETRSLQVTILDSLVKGGQYPSEAYWEMYKPSDSHPGSYEVDNVNLDLDIPDAIPYPLDTTSDPTVYDSGKVESSFRLERINSVFGKDDGTIDINSDSYKNLPSSVVITPVYYTDTGSYNYTILLNKETFPDYFRRIKITDLTPNVTGSSMKIYKIEVTIYWNVGGTEQSVTVTGEKSYMP
jgi:prepilin-type N-terminal cleavage/methylation domain-containing protein